MKPVRRALWEMMRLHRAIGSGLGALLLALAPLLADEPRVLWSFDTGG